MNTSNTHELAPTALMKINKCVCVSCSAHAAHGLAQSLLVLIQQHNMKEEQVLYPMADQVLAAPGEVVAEMAARDSVDPG